jgi:ABC-type glutathione transport system ATPase component
MSIVSVSKLTIGFGPAIAVRDASLSIEPGERIGLIGPSGSGKSTLARALHGHLPGTASVIAGTIESSGQSAYIPQEPSLSFSPFLTVGSQIQDCARAARQSANREDILAILWVLGLPNAARIFEAFPHQLSGGQMQRAAWAQALVRNPALILADEPTAALDILAQQEILELALERVSLQGIALLWISHDLQLLQRFARRILRMESGRLEELSR